ncbi:hypothetical protein Q1695_013164 [Nippostrongylus brasiliensis]|nr:hypothetical protein Q1695_013164 [Nippostrongylus brasiliensis]
MGKSWLLLVTTQVGCVLIRASLDKRIINPQEHAVRLIVLKGLLPVVADCVAVPQGIVPLRDRAILSLVLNYMDDETDVEIPKAFVARARAEAEKKEAERKAASPRAKEQDVSDRANRKQQPPAPVGFTSVSATRKNSDTSLNAISQQSSSDSSSQLQSKQESEKAPPSDRSDDEEEVYIDVVPPRTGQAPPPKPPAATAVKPTVVPIAVNPPAQKPAAAPQEPVKKPVVQPTQQFPIQQMPIVQTQKATPAWETQTAPKYLTPQSPKPERDMERDEIDVEIPLSPRKNNNARDQAGSQISSPHSVVREDEVDVEMPAARVSSSDKIGPVVSPQPSASDDSIKFTKPEPPLKSKRESVELTEINPKQTPAPQPPSAAPLRQGAAAPPSQAAKKMRRTATVRMKPTKVEMEGGQLCLHSILIHGTF